MKFRLTDLFTWNGAVDRRTYALVGLIGFAIKNNLDRWVAYSVFHRSWGLMSYWMPQPDGGLITALAMPDARFLVTMVTMSLPFIWIGLALTVKRLRSIGMPPSYALLFFLPVLNLFFFLILCLVPPRDAVPPSIASRSAWLLRVIPESAFGSAAISLIITVPLGLGMVILGEKLPTYGWGMFVALPFTMGFGAALLYGIPKPRSQAGCVGVASLSVALLGIGLLAVAIEGAVCLVMALPLALPIAMIGGEFGYLVQRNRWNPPRPPAVLTALLLFVPSVQWIEHVVAPTPPVYEVRSSIDVQAPPEKVWKQVVAFTEIPPPRELLFRAGIAYPERAEIFGTGPGAERHCVFSTGAFVEPIQIWDEPRQLKFSVTSNPPPMEEWTPYSHIDPPHLHGFLASNGGQFLLTPLPNGGTRLEGTTWYRHSLWPAGYWRLWSDAIIHQIHMRVLRHIRDEAEAKASG